MSGGILFPTTAKGDRSTTPFGKDVLSAIANTLGQEQLALAIQSEKDWRNNYTGHYMRLLEAHVRAPEDKLIQSLRAGLKKAQSMDFEADGQTVPLEKAMQGASAKFDIATIKGSGTVPTFEVPDAYHNATLTGATLEGQLDKWVNYGCMEPDCREAIKRGIKQREGLKGRTFVVIGAGSELGPLKELLRAGATVAALATRKPARWEKMIEFAKGTAGSLLLPVTSGSAGGDDKAIAAATGVDLLKEAPAVSEWVQRVVKYATGPVTIGTYLYVDGGANVLVTVASDMIVEAAAKAVGPGKISFAWLGSPATGHVVPAAVVSAQETQYGEASWYTRMACTRTAPTEHTGGDGQPRVVFDGFAVMQGPNYALAQLLRQWRAMVLHSEGFVVSTPMAPICRTESVCHNGTMKAALDGLYYLPPMEAFHPETASALMFAILASELSEPVPKLASSLEIFLRNSFHSGTWRCPFAFESAGKLLFLMGKVAGQTTPN